MANSFPIQGLPDRLLLPAKVQGAALMLKASGLRLERCPGSGEKSHGHAHLCHCGAMFSAPLNSEGGERLGQWTIPEHDGECSW